MNRNSIWAVLLLTSSLATAEVKPLSLQDCFEKARQHHELLKIRREDIARARSLRSQARGSILPEVHWVMGVTWQDTSDVGQNNNADSSLFQRRRTESRFTLDQPLFSGFKEFYAMRAYGAEARRATFSLQRAEIELYEDVSTAFLNVISNETDLFNVRTTLKFSEDRVKELKDRVRLGRSRRSEVDTAESQWASLKSIEAQVMGNVAISRESLSFLTGENLTQTPLLDNLEVPEALSNEQIDQGAENRSDLKALREEVQGKRDAIRVLQSGHWPWANLAGNYYTQRPGFFQDVDWDLILNVDVPIFQGGVVNARVKEAVAVYNQAKLGLQQEERSVRSEIRQAQILLQSSLQQADRLEQAYQHAKRSYDLQVKEYRYGLVTNLDVLQTLSSMQDLKRSWDRAVIQSKLNYIYLLAASEQNFTDLRAGENP